MNEMYLFALGGFVTTIWLSAIGFLIYGASQDGTSELMEVREEQAIKRMSILESQTGNNEIPAHKASKEFV
jgi:hypothetical protein